MDHGIPTMQDFLSNQERAVGTKGGSSATTAGPSFALLGDAELKKHTDTTVLQHLGLTEKDFATPPTVTSIRVIQRPGATTEVSREDILQRLQQGLPNFSVASMAQFGIHDGYFISKKEEESLQKTEGSVGVGKIDPNRCPILFVEAACGEAVLRGSDVYAPGIWASSGFYGPSVPGEETKTCSVARVVACTNPAAMPLKASYFDVSATKSADDGAPESKQNDEFSLTRDCVLVSSGATVDMSREDVVAGKKGVALTIHDACHPSQSAIVRSLVGGHGGSGGGDLLPFLQNFSSMVPAAMLFQPKQQRPDEARVSLLRVLDMCAAPGGKSSQLISILKQQQWSRFKLYCCERSPSRARKLKETLVSHHGAELVNSSVQLLTCDANRIYDELKNPTKSATTVPVVHNKKKAERAAKWRREHPNAFCGGTVEEEKEARPLEEEAVKDEEQKEEEVEASTFDGKVPKEFFDKILLDPPCTGLGLRPRLIPHPCSLPAVEMSGDYQRKLLDSGLRVLKVGGLLSYSTCTISREENETTVEWALKHYGNAIEVVKEDAANRCPLLDMAPYPSWLTIQGLADPQVQGDARYNLMRFGPSAGYKKQRPTSQGVAGGSSSNQLLAAGEFPDSVGFFAVCFRKIKSFEGLDL